MAKKLLIVSISSGIGGALAQSFLAKGHQVVGTFREWNPNLESLSARGVELVQCDLSDSTSVREAVENLKSHADQWDGLVLAAGTMKPVGPFELIDFDDWAMSFEVNVIQQFRILRELLASRNMTEGSSVLFFAGGGMNSAPVNVSAYTVAKIAATKLIELLAEEITDVQFFSVGPGWVETKIHAEMFEAGSMAGVQLERTKEKFATGDFVSIDDVVECCEWLMFSQIGALSGRNYSVAHDSWGQQELVESLELDPDMYKLRRWGNS